MKSLSEQTTITVTIKDFVHTALGGYYWHDRPILKEVAEQLYLLTKNNEEFGCYIQFTDEFGVKLDNPILWKYSAWAESHERYIKSQKRSQYEREQRFIFEANLKLIVKGVNRVLCVEGDAANVIAHQFLAGKQYNKIRAVGVQKLYTTIEEI